MMATFNPVKTGSSAERRMQTSPDDAGNAEWRLLRQTRMELARRFEDDRRFRNLIKDRSAVLGRMARRLEQEAERSFFEMDNARQKIEEERSKNAKLAAHINTLQLQLVESSATISDLQTELENERSARAVSADETIDETAVLKELVKSLSLTIGDRDKTIAELRAQIHSAEQADEQRRAENALSNSALEKDVALLRKQALSDKECIRDLICKLHHTKALLGRAVSLQQAVEDSPDGRAGMRQA